MSDQSTNHATPQPSHCARCGAALHCAMASGSAEPCWCTELPPVVAVPGAGAACWCRACLTDHITSLQRAHD